MVGLALAWSGSVSAALADNYSDIQTVGTTYLNTIVYRKVVTMDRYDIQVSGLYGVVRFLHGNGGGMILLSKTSGAWKVLIEGGGEINAQLMQNAGVPAADATKLLTACPLLQIQPLAIPKQLKSRFAEPYVGRGGVRFASATRCKQ